MRSMTVIRMPPPLPSKKNAAAGGTKPSLASVTVMGKSSAKADRPKQVAKVNGIQNLQQTFHHNQANWGGARGLGRGDKQQREACSQSGKSNNAVAIDLARPRWGPGGEDDLFKV